MNRLFRSIIIAAMFVVGASTVHAAPVEKAVDVSAAFSFSSFISCANGGAGEFADFSGPVNAFGLLTINDNHVFMKFHINPQGIKGVGRITGDVYNATGVTQGEMSGSLVNGQYEETFGNNFRLIGPGPDNNLLIHGTTRFVINANGDVSVDIATLSIECK